MGLCRGSSSPEWVWGGKRSGGVSGLDASTACMQASTQSATSFSPGRGDGWRRCWPVAREPSSANWSAAALWGIRDHRSGPIHTTSPRKSQSRDSIRRHRALLPADEVTAEDGIPVTSVPRTILDLASVAPHSVEPALRQSEYLRLYDSLSLSDLLDRYPGHRGNRAVRAALGRLHETPGRTRSALEDRFIAFLDRHDLPRPHFNPWIQLNPDRFQADCLWPDQRLIVELDGWSAHGTRTAFREDKARDRRRGLQDHAHPLGGPRRRTRGDRLGPPPPPRTTEILTADVSRSRPRSSPPLRAFPPAECRGSWSPGGRRPGRSRRSC